MKILSVIFSINSAAGGPVAWLRQYRRIFTEQGHQVDIASLDGPDEPFIKEWGAGVYALGPGNGTYRFSPHLLPWLKAHHHEYDKIIVHGVWQYHSFAVWQAVHKSGVPYHVFTHGMLDPWFKRTYPLKHLKKWLYWPWAEYRVLRDAESVLFTCEEERRLARQSFWLYRCHEKVISYGAAAPTGNKELQIAKFLEAFPECKGKHCLIYLGRIHEKKGCDLLLQAFASQKQIYPEAHLIMAGPCHHPEYLNKLKALAPADVTWTGMLTGDMKWGAFHASKAFALSSHQENFGVAVVEALAAGLPVLISDQVNIWREIKQDGAGLVAPDTLAGTESLLQQWFALSQAEQSAMSQCAVDCFNNRFEIHKAVDSFHATIKPSLPLASV